MSDRRQIKALESADTLPTGTSEALEAATKLPNATAEFVLLER